MKRCKQPLFSLRRLIASEQGSALPIVGFALLGLVGATGSAIDMGRVQTVQTKMTNALDAAGLAAGSTVNTVDATTEVNKYFYANFPRDYLGTHITNLTVSTSNDNLLLTLDARGEVPTTFMKVLGVNSIEVSAHSEITRANKGMELVLVMDTTGSMSDSAGGSQTKIQAARSAATELINILYGDRTEVDNLWVGLVPFAQAVNIGSTRTSWTTSTALNWGTTSWMGCVDARETNHRDVTDDPPSVELFPKYYWACHVSYNAWYGTNSSRNNCSTTPAANLRYKSGLGTGLGPNRSCSQAITQLTSHKNTVLSAISTLSPNGNTHIVLGASWAWRMLSPRWRGLWGGEMNSEQLPLDYNAPLMNKVVVLMTDGDNTISTSVKGAYGYLSEGRLGTTNSSAAVTELNNRTTQVCNSMKANGVIVYTIAFGTSIGGSARTMLQNCASKPDYYFYSPTGADLSSAFRIIGDSLANLRISK